MVHTNPTNIPKVPPPKQARALESIPSRGVYFAVHHTELQHYIVEWRTSAKER